MWPGFRPSKKVWRLGGRQDRVLTLRRHRCFIGVFVGPPPSAGQKGRLFPDGPPRAAGPTKSQEVRRTALFHLIGTYFLCLTFHTDHNLLWSVFFLQKKLKNLKKALTFQYFCWYTVKAALNGIEASELSRAARMDRSEGETPTAARLWVQPETKGSRASRASEA